jgi:hypothetical protein
VKCSQPARLHSLTGMGNPRRAASMRNGSRGEQDPLVTETRRNSYGPRISYAGSFRLGGSGVFPGHATVSAHPIIQRDFNPDSLSQAEPERCAIIEQALNGLRRQAFHVQAVGIPGG